MARDNRDIWAAVNWNNTNAAIARRLNCVESAGLSEAMEEAGRIIASPEAVDRCVNHVRLGVFIRYDVTVTVDVEGQYNVTVSSATHGTKGIIAKMKGLEP